MMFLFTLVRLLILVKLSAGKREIPLSFLMKSESFEDLLDGISLPLKGTTSTLSANVSEIDASRDASLSDTQQPIDVRKEGLLEKSSTTAEDEASMFKDHSTFNSSYLQRALAPGNRTRDETVRKNRTGLNGTGDRTEDGTGDQMKQKGSSLEKSQKVNRTKENQVQYYVTLVSLAVLLSVGYCWYNQMFCWAVPVIVNARQLQERLHKKVCVEGRINSCTKEGEVLPEVISPIAQSPCCYYSVEIVELASEAASSCDCLCWFLSCFTGVTRSQGEQFSTPTILKAIQSPNSEHFSVEVFLPSDHHTQSISSIRISSKTGGIGLKKIAYTCTRSVEEIKVDPQLTQLVTKSCPQVSSLDRLVLRETCLKSGEVMRAKGVIAHADGVWTLEPLELEYPQSTTDLT